MKFEVRSVRFQLATELDGAAYFAKQRIPSERLGEQRRFRIQKFGMRQTGVAGHVHDSRVRFNCREIGSKRAAVHAGHYNVGK